VAFIAIILSTSLLAVNNLSQSSGSAQFSELFMLGPSHNIANYPTDLKADQGYSFYVGVTNHMGSSTNYVLYLKLLNASDLLPDHANKIPSPVQPFYENRFSLQNNQTYEKAMNFSISNVTIKDDNILLGKFNLNNQVFSLNYPSVSTNSSSYRLLFELWTNNPSDGLLFDNRFTFLNFNVTKTQ
jgi:uncharacterized membrane protein